MSLNVENLVRSGVALVIGLPLTVAVAVNALPEKDPVREATNKVKAELIEPCIKWAASKNDSKLEREAKDTIDEVMGGEVNYKGICDWVL
jgi:hypothetical protein